LAEEQPCLLLAAASRQFGAIARADRIGMPTSALLLILVQLVEEARRP
jgi:hypothetical protein